MIQLDNRLINKRISSISNALHKTKDDECRRLLDMGITDITFIEFSYDPYKWFISVGEKEYQARLNKGEGI